jgi:proline dehydrogenase
MRAELFVTADCPHALAAERLLERALAHEGLAVPIERVVLGGLDDAEALAIPGSPTIRIDGRDVEPSPVGRPASDGCRLYLRDDGPPQPLPTPEAIAAAIDAARRRAEAERAGSAATRLRPAAISRNLFLWASRQDVLRRLTTSLPVTRGLVARFVAGETLDAALVALERLRAEGLRSTLDVLGESVRSPEDAEAAVAAYLRTLDALEARDLDRNVSLKLTQMGLESDPDVCRQNLARIAARAAEIGAFVRVDMEDHTRTDVTLGMAREQFRRSGNVGVVIQSYLRRSATDIAELNAEGIRVRLCKGAYDEPASVAYTDKADVDASYRESLERLLLDGTYPALATHDDRLIRHAIDFSRQHGIGRDRFEFQMLYGVRRDLQRRLVAAGWTVRVYVPYGEEWYPYFMRRLAERPANVMFVLRSLVPERSSGEGLEERSEPPSSADGGAPATDRAA